MGKGKYKAKWKRHMGGDGDVPKEVKIEEIALDAQSKGEIAKAQGNAVKAELRKSSIFTFLKRDLSPYIVLIGIFIVIGIIVAGAVSIKPAARGVRRGVHALWDAIMYPFRWLFGPMFDTLGYRIRLGLRMFIPFGGKAPSIPRERILSGRCDNQKWIQVDMNDAPQLDVDGKRGYCMSATRPKDIEWTLDTARMPEYSEIPQELRKNMQSKMTVIIPYDKEETVQNGNTFFVPRCDKAYFKDAKDEKGQPIRAELLEEMGTSCKLASHPFAKGSYGVDGATKAALLQTQKW